MRWRWSRRGGASADALSECAGLLGAMLIPHCCCSKELSDRFVTNIDDISAKFDAHQKDREKLVEENQECVGCALAWWACRHLCTLVPTHPHALYHCLAHSSSPSVSHFALTAPPP